MIIRTQDENAIYDFEKMSGVYTNEDGNVYALGYTGELAFPLGTYATQERAREIIGDIYALVDSQSRFDMPIV